MSVNISYEDWLGMTGLLLVNQICDLYSHADDPFNTGASHKLECRGKVHYFSIQLKL